MKTRVYLKYFVHDCRDKVVANLYQDAKNQTISSICSEEIVDLKILHSDWLRGFWPNLRNKIFPKYGIFEGTHQIIYIFIIEQMP